MRHSKKIHARLAVLALLAAPLGACRSSHVAESSGPTATANQALGPSITDDLTGYYTYRSFRNEPRAIPDLDRLLFGEAELLLFVGLDGTITGTLAFPADPGARRKEILDLSGQVTSWSPPLTMRFTGRGRPDTAVSDYEYEYEGSVAPAPSGATDQPLALVGTVLRARDHAAGSGVAPAGVTASFVAVKRDFVEPRDVPGAELLPEALAMLASKVTRLRHTVWHTLRGEWRNLSLEAQQRITELGWGVRRPPFVADRTLDLTNGAGEDFLIMHRRMIAMVHGVYAEAGVPPIESWKTLPVPLTPQFVYVEADSPTVRGEKIFVFDPLRSGFMVPPAAPDDGDSVRFLKTPAYFRSVMSNLEGLYQSPRHLAGLSLGALGNLLEFTIHNQMHVRWMSVSRDPQTGEPALRCDYDFSEKWDDPRYDFLGEFYSSHVSPLFWRLHGWVDDRIEDWFQAHEQAHPGEVVRAEVDGVPWFAPGAWVSVAEPFTWPATPSDKEAVATMLAVMDVVKAEIPSQCEDAERWAEEPTSAGVTTFLRAIEPDVP